MPPAAESIIEDEVSTAEATHSAEEPSALCVADGEATELADLASSAEAIEMVGEVEEVELAAQVVEVTDFASEVTGGASDPASAAATSTSAPAIGSLLDFESPLNLRLATLTRQTGKAFRAIAVHLPMEHTTINFNITFEDISSGARLVCTLEDVKTHYVDWIAQFRATFVALFLPTLQHANATLLQNAVLSARPARSPPPPGSYHPRLNDDADHLFFSYGKLREVISKKKRDFTLNTQLLTVTVLNAYAEEWRNFISAPLSCAPQSFLLAAFNFQPKDSILLNKELLQSQLGTAADAMLMASSKRGGSTQRHSGKNHEQWSLVFVSAPGRSVAGLSVIPPMQDLVTGQFLEPLTLSQRHVVYIIGSGTAAQSFAHFPLARKGKVAFSILLQDIESQLGLQKPHRSTLTVMLVQALDTFSRLTWMGLMRMETDNQVRVQHPPNAFYRLQRRTVQREILPSFLEAVFAPSHRLGPGGTGAGGPGAPEHTAASVAGTVVKSTRRLEEHIGLLFNNKKRLETEQELREQLMGCRAIFVNLSSASVTAARRADNPFSIRNGIMEASTQLWDSLTLPNPPPILSLQAKTNASGTSRKFVLPDEVIPAGLPTGSPGAPNPKDRAENVILVAWDAKRILLFLRESKRLQEFLCNGGKIWCAQYAQYLLKGFNHMNLATMERTLLQYHDGPLKTTMHPLAKLKFIFQTQLDVAVNTRQLTSILHRMDGLLASAEMEKNGLQLAPQSEVTQFANKLRLSHEHLERVLQDKIMDFTKGMDDDVRQRINFRSPQDISSIIYGGALCRHLGSRFVPVRPTKFPVTALFPHLVCQVTGTPIPSAYTQAESLLGSFQQSSSPYNFSAADVDRSVRQAQQLCKRATMENLLHTTAVVVLLCKAKLGGLLEQVSLYCPGASSDIPEINIRIATDEILPVSDSPDLVTVAQLKQMIADYKPLHQIQPLKKCGKKSYDLRNVLILTNSTHERLEPLVDTGVIEAVEQAVLGTTGAATKGSERPPFERVCFADLTKCFPPPSQATDGFESDFTELSGGDSVTFSAKANWESQAKELVTLGGVEGTLQALVSHCASLVGTPRDAFRSPHPVPSCCPRGLHGQEQASTSGMLWMVTPPSLHPVLRRFLKGRSASSGADAMERVTVFLSPYNNIDLSFFTALQQLRFTEKKMQLFEEGCLFRAVLPECNDQVHGELCHCVTATGRLSSQSPNLQNIPKEEDLRCLIRSRFGASGRMIEADYSQLEVIVLAALSRDPRMMQEIRDQVDFHCLRVSLMTKEPYEEIAQKVKVLKDPRYIQLRQQAKVFSFQRQYGAGVSTIATTTGLTEQEVERLIAAEENHYKELGRYYRLVMDSVEAGADRLLRLRTLDTATWSANTRRIIMLTEPLYYFVVATGSKFDFAKDRKSVPRLKNYPVQGLAGEIVQIMCGKIVRRFYERRNYNNKAFLVNTVHDCVWVDVHESVEEEVKADLDRILGSTQEVIGNLWPDMELKVPFKAEVHAGRSLGNLS